MMLAPTSIRLHRRADVGAQLGTEEPFEHGNKD